MTSKLKTNSKVKTTSKMNTTSKIKMPSKMKTTSHKMDHLLYDCSQQPSTLDLL